MIFVFSGVFWEGVYPSDRGQIVDEEGFLLLVEDVVSLKELWSDAGDKSGSRCWSTIEVEGLDQFVDPGEHQIFDNLLVDICELYSPLKESNRVQLKTFAQIFLQQGRAQLLLDQQHVLTQLLSNAIMLC